MTSIHRPCCSAMARASSARTAGLTSFEARFESVRARFAPSAMIDPALGGPGRGRRRPRRVRRGSARRGPAAASRPRRGRSCAGRSCPRRRRGRRARRRRPRRRRERRREGRARSARPLDRPAAETALGRGRDPHDGLAIEGRGVAQADDEQPSRRRLAPGREGRRVALARSARRTRRVPGARRRPAGRARRAVPSKAGFAATGTTRTSAGHVPRLIGDDTELHGCRILRKRDRRGAALGIGLGGLDRAASVATRPGVRGRPSLRAPLDSAGRRAAARVERVGQLGPRLLDGDDRAVHPAPSDVGHDDDQPAGVRWQAGARGGLRLDRGPRRRRSPSCRPS